MQRRVAQFLLWLDARQWGRLLFFIVVPFLLIALIYLWPSIASALVLVALGDLVLLIFYLKVHRPTNLSLVVAIVPNTVGPLLASLYADKLLINGEQLLRDGADIFVAIAFLFAGYVTLLLYLLARQIYNWPERFAWFLLLIIPFSMALGGTEFATKALVDGPTVLGNVHAPAITALFVCRAIVAFIAALIAVIADHESDVPVAKGLASGRESD